MTRVSAELQEMLTLPLPPLNIGAIIAGSMHHSVPFQAASRARTTSLPLLVTPSMGRQQRLRPNQTSQTDVEVSELVPTIYSIEAAQTSGLPLTPS